MKREAVQKDSNIKIGFFWPDKHLETTISNVVMGINSALQFEISPVDMSIFPFGYNALSSQGVLWSSKSLDAAVILSPNTADMQFLAQHHPKMPTVLINRQQDNYSYVATDYEEVGRLAAEQAIAKGGDDIALIRNIVPHMGMSHRSLAIYNVCKAYGINLDERIYYCDNGIDEAYELGIKLLRAKHLPKVIVCVYDADAFGIIRAFNEAGVVVGKDVEIIATSTSYPQFFARATPSITVVDLKTAMLTQKAIRIAIDFASHRLTEPTKIVVSPEIVYRESSPIPSREQLKRLREYKLSAHPKTADLNRYEY